jgi:hypothetical protein
VAEVVVMAGGRARLWLPTTYYLVGCGAVEAHRKITEVRERI